MPAAEFDIIAAKLDYVKGIFPDFELLDVKLLPLNTCSVEISIGNATQIWNLSKLIQIIKMEEIFSKK